MMTPVGLNSSRITPLPGLVHVGRLFVQQLMEVIKSEPMDCGEVKDESIVKTSEYVRIMETLKGDVGKILEPLQLQKEDKRFKVCIQFERKPNQPEKDRQDYSRKRIRIKQIANPLDYAWEKHLKYTPNFSRKMKILFVGMNPSTKAPSGIPFPHKDVMNHWSIQVENENESGRRFWNMIKEFVGDIDKFHEHGFVINSTPLFFVGDVQPVNPANEDDSKSEIADRSITLDNFYDSDLEKEHFVRYLLKKSDEALTATIKLMEPELIIAIGWYSWVNLRKLNCDGAFNIGSRYIPMPSPKSFDNEENWIDAAEKKLQESGAGKTFAEIRNQ